jgi:pimeloyl-ACP methyl ester carboxylesterase
MAGLTAAGKRLSRTALLLVLLAALLAAGAAAPASAERLLDEASIQIKGEARRYYRLYDTEAPAGSPAIVLVSGSGCNDYSGRFAKYFKNYPASLDLYFLEKPHIAKGDSGEPGTCSEAYNRADTLGRRVADTLEFIAQEPRLQVARERSLAILGFSEGGQVAPMVAARSRKIGWLAVIGAGGMKQAEGFLAFADRGVAPYADFTRKRLEAEFAAIAAEPDSLSKEFFGHPYAYWSSHLFQDPLAEYAQLDMPIVVAMGEQDDAEPVESGRLLQRYFAQRPAKDFQFIEYRNAGHGLKAGDKSHIEDFIAALAAWFKGERKAFGQ